MTIRPATSEDLESYCQLSNAIWPSWALKAEQLARDDLTLPEPMRARRWLAEVEGHPVGFAEAHRPAGTFHLGKWQIDVGVAFSHRGQGIGSALFAEAEASIQEGEVIHVSTYVREDDDPHRQQQREPPHAGDQQRIRLPAKRRNSADAETVTPDGECDWDPSRGTDRPAGFVSGRRSRLARWQRVH